MQPVQLILVGGFLGAGKTTLLWQAAGRLMARGKRVGLITNDQAPDLVDTGLLVGRGLDVGEVSGSCFCCNFPGLVEAARTLKGDMHADVLIAEPVGSCTDLSATILQPLKHSYRNEFALSPLTVLADPMRLKHVLAGQAGPLHPSAAYILLKQLEEADVIVVNKAELLSPNETAELSAALAKAFPGVEVRFLSALTGQGIDDWLDWALAGGQAGQRIAQVDYDTYAEGEAALGWLNAHVAVSRRDEKADWRAFCREMMESLKAEFARRLANVGHVKMLLSTPQGHYACNLTRTDGDIAVGGDIQGSPRQAEMIVNARVEIEPQELEGIVRGSLQAASRLCFDATVSSLRSLRPGRPAPTHRYAAPL